VTVDYNFASGSAEVGADFKRYLRGLGCRIPK